GLEDVVEAPGFVGTEQVELDLARALCLVLPSRREGYGLIVVEASSYRTPSVLVRHPDNAATELIEDGINGFVVPDANPRSLADAIVRVHTEGGALRTATAEWFAANARRLSLSRSLNAVVESYGRAT